ESAEMRPERNPRASADEREPDVHEHEPDNEAEQARTERAHDGQNAADGPGRADHRLEGSRVDQDVQESSAGSRGQVEGKKSKVAHRAFDDRAREGQADHVPDEMDPP